MNLDFLNGDESPEPIVTPETVEAAPEANPGQPRGPDGKFVSAAPEPAPEPAPAAPVVSAPAEPASPPPGFVPVSVVQELRREMRELRHPVEPVAPPTVYDEGYEQYMAAQVHNAALNNKLDISEELARQAHGDDLVDKARDWALQRFAESPAFRQEVLSQRNPYGYAVKEFQRQQALSELNDPAELQAFKAWKAAQALAQQPAAAPAAPPPPRSIASAPSAGGVQHVPTGAGQAFDNVFKR